MTNPADTLALALEAARRDGVEVRSMKDLLCDGCGAGVAAVEGLCLACDAELAEHFDERAASLGCEVDDGFALACAAAYDDPEAAAALAGAMPGKF